MKGFGKFTKFVHFMSCFGMSWIVLDVGGEDSCAQELQLRLFWQWQFESTYGVVYAVAAAVESTSPIAGKA